MLTWVSLSMIIGSAESAFAWEKNKVDGVCPATHPQEIIHPEAGACSNSAKECSSTAGKFYEGDSEPAACKGDSEDGGSATESAIAAETLQKFISLLLALEGMLSRLLWPILFMIGGLLQNDILFGGGMEDVLYNIWVPIRNIVNIMFVIALVGLALYSVLGVNSENSQYSIKALLPKLIAGIIAVNFSFLIIKVFLDSVNVFTTAIFAIPVQTTEAILGNDNPEDKAKQEQFCKEIYGITKKDAGVPLKTKVEDLAAVAVGREFGMETHSKKGADILAAAALMEPAEKRKVFDDRYKYVKDKLAICMESENKLMLSDAGKAFFLEYGSSNAALAMAINMGEILFYKKVSATMGSGTIESFTINAIFSVLLYVVYMVSFLALFVVLLARLIVMWLGLALSPIIALSIAVPMAKDKLGLGELTEKFVAHAIAPITISLTMTVGWIMLKAVKTTVSSKPSLVSTEGLLIPALPIPGLETLQGLLVSIATVAVVWIGVFMATDKTIAGKFTGFIKEKLESFGGWVATAPFKYTPWVPVEVGEGEDVKTYTPDAILAGLDSWKNNVGRKEREKFGRDFNISGMGSMGTSAIVNGMTANELAGVSANNTINESELDTWNDEFKTLRTSTATTTELKNWQEGRGTPDQKSYADIMLPIILGSKKLDAKNAEKLKTLGDRIYKAPAASDPSSVTPGGEPTVPPPPAPDRAPTDAAKNAITADEGLMKAVVGAAAVDRAKTADGKITQEEEKKFEEAIKLKESMKVTATNPDGANIPKLAQDMHKASGGKLTTDEAATYFNKEVDEANPGAADDVKDPIKNAFREAYVAAETPPPAA